MLSFLFFLLCQDLNVSLNIDQAPSMTYPIWATWLHDSGNWIIVPFRNEDGAVTIRKWDKDNDIKVIARTGLREGIAYASYGAIDDKGMLYVRGMVSPNVLMLDTRAEQPKFKKYGSALDLNGNYFVHQGLLIGGAHDLNLKGYPDELSGSLYQVARRLPKAKHPSQGHDNRHKMLLSFDGDILAISYTLYDEFAIVDLSKKSPPKFQKLRFRGYVSPFDVTYPKKYSDKAELAYMNDIHHLDALAIHKGRVYGRFRKGFSGFGIWVDLLDPKAFTYDNNRVVKKVVAVSQNEIVLGEYSETEDGLITWTYSRSSSLPLSGP